MHLCCPRCDTAINVYDYNLFEIWTCKKCEWRFRGVHARLPVLRTLINSFIAPVYTNTNLLHLGNCPYCGSLVDLNYIGIHTYSPRTFGQYRHLGYNGPYVCKRCCKDLPWDYPDQFEHVAKSFNNEHFPEGSNSTKAEASAPVDSNFAKMAQDLFKKKHNIA